MLLRTVGTVQVSVRPEFLLLVLLIQQGRKRSRQHLCILANGGRSPAVTDLALAVCRRSSRVGRTMCCCSWSRKACWPSIMRISTGALQFTLAFVGKGVRSRQWPCFAQQTSTSANLRSCTVRAMLVSQVLLDCISHRVLGAISVVGLHVVSREPLLHVPPAVLRALA